MQVITQIFVIRLKNNMRNSGQDNYSGINAQSWAAMSLFLQFLRDQKFSYIALEAPGFQDFNLVFEDGRKIICESKNRKANFSHYDLKKVLQNRTISRSIKGQDEILIICKNADKNLVSEIRHVKFFKNLREKFKTKGYSNQQINLLLKVKFWIVPSSFNENIIYTLFADLINFWLPSEYIKKIVDHILVQKIYKGSAKGSTYSRIDILKEINDLAEEAKENSVYYSGGFKKRVEQFNELDTALSNPNHSTWKAPKELSAFSTDYERLKFVKDRLIGRKNQLVLKNWDPVWQLNRVQFFNFGIFDIFENNLRIDQNKKYILDYLKKYTKTIRGFYRLDYFNVNTVRIVAKIIDTDKRTKYLKDALAIIKDLITFNEKEFFYLKNSSYDHGQWEKGEICKLLQKIYKRSDALLKQQIFDLIISGFNITEDDGEFSHHAPEEVFEILREWLDEDFDDRFKKLVKELTNQYDRYYKKFGERIKFDGWEHSGSAVSYFGGYHASDRHFVVKVLKPVIENRYKNEPKKYWGFIKQYCIAKTEAVSKTKPDFLNRSVYQVALNRYQDNDRKVSSEAFEIIKDFILSRRGIPHKTDLIYQAVVNSNMSEDKKWKLVEITVKKYNLPDNPFVEQIVASLAQKGHQGAKNVLKKWYADPKYYTSFIFNHDLVSTIHALLDADLDFATELFKIVITNEHAKSEKSDNFSAYDVGALLYEIIKKDYSTGLSILRLLETEKQLSQYQQIVYSFGLFNHRGNDDSDDLELLSKIYGEVIEPFLTDNSDNIVRICQRLTVANCREAFVQFAVRLAAKKKIAEALRILRIFINDPDPYLPGQDPHDPENKYNEHNTITEGKEPSAITSVRGWCGWALMKCSVLDGREHLEEIIELSKKLVEDKNYYVVHMACFALEQIARSRLTVLPSNRNALFFNDNKKKALQMAKGVERIAFDLIDKFTKWPAPAQKAMAKSILHVFDSIRALNEEDSLKLVNTLIKFPQDSIEDTAGLLIFFAEFRKGAYKNWKLSLPGLYDNLGPTKYDARKFSKILDKTIQGCQQNNPDSCFPFAAAFEKVLREMAVGNEIEKYTGLAFKYFDLFTNVYGHNIFTLIYRIIENKFEQSDKYLVQWFNLLIKCLGIEKDFYEKEKENGNIANVYWYPSIYHSRILELVHEKMSQDKFMQAATIFFTFPKELDLNETANLVSIIQKLENKNQEAKTIIKNLIEKNPSKYWSLKGRSTK